MFGEAVHEAARAKAIGESAADSEFEEITLI